MNAIRKTDLQFLQRLENNNNREWFNNHKTEFLQHKENLKFFFNSVLADLSQHDQIEKLKIFRIYRDIRFSKNKLPYKTHFAASYRRVKPQLRGGYYIHIKPNDKSFIATGFWNPEKNDLLRIRKELERDADELRDIIKNKTLSKTWGELRGDELKTAPRDFDKEHPDIDLIRKKQFIFSRKFTDNEVLSAHFKDNIEKSFLAIRPFFNYMSDVLTTNLNGESIL
jgi:uncharacterized protein (TIGR02453 family)